MQITQLRNATVLLEFQSQGRPVGLLVDPMLAPRGSLPALRYLGTGRQRNPIVELPEGTDALLGRVTHALITHCQRGHFDHLDRAGKRFLRERQIPVICMPRDADYLAQRGTPKAPADLHGHACINWRLQMDGRTYRWEFEKKGKRVEIATEGPLVTNHSDMGVAAAVQGLGIAYAFDRERVDNHIDQGRLVQVLADWSVAKPGLFLYYSNRRHPSPALTAFIDCLLDRDLPEPRPGVQRPSVNAAVQRAPRR